MGADQAAQLHLASVPDEMAGWRFDRVLCRLFAGYSRAQVKAAIAAGEAAVDDTVCTQPRFAVVAGSVVKLRVAKSVQQEAPVLDLPPLVHEDDHLLVVDKPAGLIVHPGSGQTGSTLADSLAAARSELADLPRSGLVHRLDKDTSGLLLVGKSLKIVRKLQKQISRRDVARRYLAIVSGQPPPTGVIDRPLSDDPVHRTRKRVAEQGRDAITRFTVLDTNDGYSLLRCRLETGRTHQIRVHLEHIGHPVVGDAAYTRHARSASAAFPRQMLHAHELEFTHPATGEQMAFASELPADFQAALHKLELNLC